MSGFKVVQFDARDFCKLVTHYTDGRLPVDFELDHVAMDTILKRQVAFIGRSRQWADEPIPGKDEYNPLHIRYDKKRVMSWGSKGEDPFWQDAPDAPKLQ